MSLMLIECHEDNSLIIIEENDLVLVPEKKICVGEEVRFF